MRLCVHTDGERTLPWADLYASAQRRNREGHNRISTLAYEECWLSYYCCVSETSSTDFNEVFIQV